MSRRGKRSRKGLPVVHPKAAGVDVGSEMHFVAVPEGCCDEPVQSFGAVTAELKRLADWLGACGVTTVAMESTGVYWIPLYQILERRGFEVRLVNARHVKNVPGRKSDVQDCRWLQTLHSYGLLTGSFRPDDAICVLRSYLRHRDNLVRESSAHVQRIQKALTQMNVLLHKVIADVTGVTGLRIIDAIIEGERDPMMLAELRDRRIRKSKKQIAEALEGDYREEHIFVLRHERELYATLQMRIAEVDRVILDTLGDFDARAEVDPKAATNKKRPELRQALHRMIGVDLTAIPGVDVLTVLVLISEIGLDMERWPTAKHFASWLRLCPRNDITGGKVVRRGSVPGPHRAAATLRLAAQSAGRTQTAIGGFYRQKRSAIGAPKAIRATAHKLARTIYYLLRTGQEYQATTLVDYERAHHERSIRNLKRRAKSLGFQVVEAA